MHLSARLFRDFLSDREKKHVRKLMKRFTEQLRRAFCDRIACRCLAVLLVAFTGWVQPCAGTPAGDGMDPVCSVPNRLNIVLAARAKARQRLRHDRQHVLVAQTISDPMLGLSWDPKGNLPHLFLRGPARQAWQVDSTSALDAAGW